MQVHRTKALVLKTLPYSETSLIVKAYTEAFGIQTYLVKSARKVSKKGSSAANYYQPGALLHIVCTHDSSKNFQFIKEVSWHIVFTQIFSVIHKNVITLFVVELIVHSIQQQETNVELFDFFEASLSQLDGCLPHEAANFPIVFGLKFAAFLGFGLQDNFSAERRYLHVIEGEFCEQPDMRIPFFDEQNSFTIYKLLKNETQQNVQLNRLKRRDLLQGLQLFYEIHIADFGKLKSLDVLFQLFDE